jgi:hypothetical protein
MSAELASQRGSTAELAAQLEATQQQVRVLSALSVRSNVQGPYCCRSHLTTGLSQLAAALTACGLCLCGVLGLNGPRRPCCMPPPPKTPWCLCAGSPQTSQLERLCEQLQQELIAARGQLQELGAAQDGLRAQVSVVRLHNQAMRHNKGTALLSAISTCLKLSLMPGGVASMCQNPYRRAWSLLVPAGGWCACGARHAGGPECSPGAHHAPAHDRHHNSISSKQGGQLDRSRCCRCWALVCA